MATEPFATSIHIEASPERVFEHFVDPDRLVAWMGQYALLEPTPGGRFEVDINGVPVRGAYVEIDAPKRLVLSWGHAGSTQLPPHASTVEITFAAQAGGTLVQVVHHGLPEPEAAQHATGWEHFLARLAVSASGRDPGPDPWAQAST